MSETDVAIGAIAALQKQVAGLQTHNEVLYRDNVSLSEVADSLRAKLQAAEKRTAALVELADDYASHDSWRCGYYDECHCGLNDLQKKAGLELSPCGYAKDTNEAP